jgi:hypothetical protein
MKLTGSVVVCVLLLASTVFAGSPPVMTPSQQYEVLVLRDAQFAARYSFFANQLRACGGTIEITPGWAAADATFNAWILNVCGGTDPNEVYNTASNQCTTGVTLTSAQQYQTLLLRVAQYSARYAALEPQANTVCNDHLAPIPPDWEASDQAMNTFLTATCGSPARYSTTTNNCK